MYVLLSLSGPSGTYGYAHDWTVLPDVTDANVPGDKDEWVTYRQALRDIPQQATFPGHFDWPVQPTEV